MSEATNSVGHENAASLPLDSRTSDGEAPSRTGRCAVLIDVANAEKVDIRQLLTRSTEYGRLQEVRAYGDFRQRHLDPLAIELYALGIETIHCPSWPNGGRNGDGTARRKRSDDRLLEKRLYELLGQQPAVSTYVVVTSDADIIPVCNYLARHGREVILFCPDPETTVGHVLQQANFRMEAAPMVATPSGSGAPIVDLSFLEEGCAQS